MTTQQLLDILRDARDQGLWQEQAAIVEEIGADVAYVTCSAVAGPRANHNGWLTPCSATLWRSHFRQRAGESYGLSAKQLAPPAEPREWYREYLGRWTHDS